MPGFELFDQREIDAVTDVIKRKMVHRYSFQETRNDIYRVEEFEKAVAEKFGAKHCLAVSSGSAALYVGLRGLGIGPGTRSLLPRSPLSPAWRLSLNAVPFRSWQRSTKASTWIPTPWKT